jgi:hypothetical protein
MLPINAFSPRGGRGPFARGMTLEGGKGGGGGAPSPDPNIGLAQQEMAKISREYLENWKTEVWPQMKEAAEKQEVRADEQFALDRKIQEKQIKAADTTMAEFNRNAGSREAIYKEAEDYSTAENKERIAAEAIGDIKTSFGVQAADLERRNQSYGINPTSGRSMATQNANSVMQAATEGAAATRARNAAEQLGWAKKMDAIGLSQGQFGNQATSTGLALNAGAQGFGIGQQSFGNYGALGNSMSQATNTANQGWNNVGQLGVQKYQADISRYNAEQQANAASSAGFGSALGAIGGAAMKYAPAMIAASDIRMKENIEVVGHLPNGLAVYEFDYKPEFKDTKYAGHGRFRGLMAHEVEAVNPEAVFTTSDGYKAIDYSKVN